LQRKLLFKSLLAEKKPVETQIADDDQNYQQSRFHKRKNSDFTYKLFGGEGFILKKQKTQEKNKFKN
jgi:hypothetical protein